MQKWESEPARFVRAQDVVRLRPVSGLSDLPQGASSGFTPAFLHQYFEDESIALPEADRPLRIEVLYGASTLKLHMRCDRPMEGTVEDAMYALAVQLPCVENEASALLSGGPTSAADLIAYGELVGEYVAPEAGLGHRAAGGAAACGGGAEAARTFYSCDVRCGSLTSFPALASLNQRLQSLMRFEIDAHSPIDPAEERWRVFTVWDKGPPRPTKRKAEADAPSGATPPELAAAATVFLFQRWVEGRPRLVVKVCQVLVLPPHRRRGHASSLLRCLCAYALQHDAVELTVEDPSPAFRLVRDLVDLDMCRERNLLIPTTAGAPMGEQARQEARQALRITDEQIARCYEMRCLEMLMAELGALPENKTAPAPPPGGISGAPLSEAAEALARPFRLNVKRRLNRKYEETLKAIDEPAARKAELEALYQALADEYRLLLERR